MEWATRLDHFVEKTASAVAHEIKDDAITIEHDAVNAARVGAVLVEGAYDYTVKHPMNVAKTAAITIGTGALVGAAMALLPESLALGAVVGVGGALVGAVGLTSMGVQTYDAFKESWPDLKIVWDADHHNPAEVRLAEQVVKENTGATVANAALLLPCFYLGNVAGNLGSDAVLAGRAASAAEAAVDGATGGVAAVAAGSGFEASTPQAQAAVLDSANTWTPPASLSDGSATLTAGSAASLTAPPPPVADSAVVALATVADTPVPQPAPADSASALRWGLKEIWNYVNHNPLEDLPNPTSWMRLNNNGVFGFESNYYLEKADIDAVTRLPFRIIPAETSAALEQHGKESG